MDHLLSPDDLEIQDAYLAVNEESLAAELAKVQDTRRRVRAQILRERSRSAPISFLPNELVLQIFEEGSAEDEDFAMLVSSVCGRWRNLSVKEPRIWSRIVFYETFGSIQNLRLRLDRSASWPIELTLHIGGHVLGGRIRDTALTHLKPHMHRCHRFTLLDEILEHQTLASVYAHRYLYALAGAGGRHLEYLHLDFGRLNRLPVQSGIILRSHVVPALKTLKLSGVVTIDLSTSILITSLTEVDIDFGFSVDYSSLKVVLVEARSLQRLSLTSATTRGWDEGSAPILLPTLLYLRCSLWESDDKLYDIVRFIEAPSLDELRIETRAFSDTPEFADPLELDHDDGTPRFPALRALDLVEASAFGESPGYIPIEDLLPTLPHISSLSIGDVDEDYWLFRINFTIRSPDLKPSLGSSRNQWPALDVVRIQTPSNKMLNPVLEYVRCQKLLVNRETLSRIRAALEIDDVANLLNAYDLEIV